jgi:hypothetical protein
MRQLEVTPLGIEAVRRSRDMLLSFLDGLGPVLDTR